MSAVNLVDYAVELRTRGYICVPLAKGGKHLDLSAMEYEPLHLRSLRADMKELAFTGITFSMSQRPPDVTTIKRWFGGHEGNIGILGGVGDLLILDFDHGGSFERWRRKNAALAASTPLQQTPKGCHLFLKCPAPAVSSSLHFGFRRAGHIKALGGYVVASPSTLKDGSTYRWLPGQSLIDIEPRTIDNLQSLLLQPVSPLKRYYDRCRGRGFFEAQ